MSQFDLIQWCDFVRGVADDEEAESMQRALLGGSQDAHHDVDMLRRVAEVIEADQTQPVPEHAVRMAKAIGSLQRPESAPTGPGLLSKVLRYLPFEVSFDSALQPSAAGTRGLQTHDRHVSFEANGFLVDLRIERDHDTTSVVGQVLQEAAEGTDDEVVPVPYLSIVSMQERRIVGQSVTGEMGEFQAEDLPQENLKLCFLVNDDDCIEFPMDA